MDDAVLIVPEEELLSVEFVVDLPAANEERAH